MAKGSVTLSISDLVGEPVSGRLSFDIRPHAGEQGAGGEAMTLTTGLSGGTDIAITNIPCRGGIGTLYRFSISHPHFRSYAFFQMIREGENTASEDVSLWVDPGRVRSIAAPEFDALPPRAQEILEKADMRTVSPDDRDLLSLQGKSLYDAMGPLRMACFLNLVKKASNLPTADNSFKFVRSLLLSRQDRFFAYVSDALPQKVRNSPVFKSAPDTLHTPLPGFVLAEGSFKTRDAHANLQITFMREKGGDALAADIDIDEASGIEHGFEVIRNATFKKKTNPYLIREFMLAAELREKTMDPGYRFVF
jgi:hypothetical protein